MSLLSLLLVCLNALVHGQLAFAHDPSAWGGVFRTRDFGGSWLAADAGLFIGAALALSVSPNDPNHLLYATDTRLLHSRNGGRDWTQDAADKLIGPTTAVSFDQEGRGAVASSSAGVFHTKQGDSWQESSAPAGAGPARTIVAGTIAGHFYLGGPKGVFASRDRGASFTRLGEGVLPEGMVTGLAVVAGAQETVFGAVDGELWQSEDGGTSWRRIGGGISGDIEALASDPGKSNRLWAAAGNRLYRSEDGGFTWRAIGEPLTELNTSIRAIAASADQQSIVLATHRGALRSADGGKRWELIEATLPVHLEAGLLVRDPHDAQTLYAGFALIPYPEIYRRAVEGNNLLSQVDPISLAGGLAFLLLLIIVGWLLARRLFQGEMSRR